MRHFRSPKPSPEGQNRIKRRNDKSCWPRSHASKLRSALPSSIWITSSGGRSGTNGKGRVEVTKARVAFDNADKRRSLLPELVDKGFIPKSALEEAELKYFETKRTFQAGQFDVERVSKGATQEELEKAQIRLEQAKIAIEQRSQHGVAATSPSGTVDREKRM